MHVRVWGFAGLFPKIALAIGVLTSSWGVRVRRFCGFVAGGAVTQGVVGGVVWCVDNNYSVQFFLTSRAADSDSHL